MKSSVHHRRFILKMFHRWNCVQIINTIYSFFLFSVVQNVFFADICCCCTASEFHCIVCVSLTNIKDIFCCDVNAAAVFLCLCLTSGMCVVFVNSVVCVLACLSVCNVSVLCFCPVESHGRWSGDGQSGDGVAHQTGLSVLPALRRKPAAASHAQRLHGWVLHHHHHHHQTSLHC